MLLYTLDNKSFNIFKTDSNILSWEWKNYIILRILYHHTTWYTYSKTKILFVSIMLQSNFLRAIDDGILFIESKF